MWNRNALKGLAYVFTDKGLLKVWMQKIGRSADNKCKCGEPQNVVHILKCTLVGDGKGRSKEQAEKDEEWCEAAWEFLKESMQEL